MSRPIPKPIPWQRLVLPSFIALPVLAVLLGLGTWQLQRLQWKNGLIAELEAAAAAPPVEASDSPPAFTRITATGRLRPAPEAHLGLEVRGTTLGADLVSVLDRRGGRPLLVIRGWAPLEGGNVQRPEGEVTLSGYARYSDRRAFMAATDDPAARRFYTFDLRAIAASLGVPDAMPYALAVVVPAGRPAASGGLGASAPAMPAVLPDPAGAFPMPNNPHLGYAITWFGLAAAWVVIFALWSIRRVRET
ncbi:SURF1 family protein [Roseococcus sp. YIM B11640]|uniref:SURF1 family protein n=1 Tax=Roseococcus sp. YIM B11640 TaxID=3133973 RepID=UPI003C79825A